MGIALVDNGRWQCKWATWRIFDSCESHPYTGGSIIATNITIIAIAICLTDISSQGTCGHTNVAGCCEASEPEKSKSIGKEATTDDGGSHVARNCSAT